MSIEVGGGPGMLRPKQVAAWFGFSVRTLWRYVAEGEFPEPRRFGKRKKIIRWERSAIEQWLQNGCIRAEPAR